MRGVEYERELKKQLEKQGYLVIRSAGSLGIDLIAVKPNGETKIIEIKSTRKNKYYTVYHKEQYDILNTLAEQGFNIYYYIRWVGRDKKTKWSVYKLPLPPYPVFTKPD